MGSEHATLDALTDIITEVEHLISTCTPLPAGRTPRCVSLLRAAAGHVEELKATIPKTRASGSA